MLDSKLKLANASGTDDCTCKECSTLSYLVFLWEANTRKTVQHLVGSLNRKSFFRFTEQIHQWCLRGLEWREIYWPPWCPPVCNMSKNKNPCFPLQIASCDHAGKVILKDIWVLSSKLSTRYLIKLILHLSPCFSIDTPPPPSGIRCLERIRITYWLQRLQNLEMPLCIFTDFQ